MPSRRIHPGIARARWAACALALGFGCAPEPAPRCRWVADRGADELVALDPELVPLERIPLPSPRLVDARAGVLWTAVAPVRTAPWPARLVRIELASGATRETDFRVLVALCTEETGTALVLERASPEETWLWRVGEGVRRTLLGRFPEARALAARAGEIVVGGASGELACLRADGAVIGFARGPGPVWRLAPGPRAGEWWVLRGLGETRLALLARGLDARWSVGTSAARGFAPVPGEERVWMVAEGRALCFGRKGTLEAEFALEMTGGPFEPGAASASGVLLFGAGALVEIACGRGPARVRRTQGGFAALSALAVEPGSCLEPGR